MLVLSHSELYYIYMQRDKSIPKDKFIQNHTHMLPFSLFDQESSSRI